MSPLNKNKYMIQIKFIFKEDQDMRKKTYTKNDAVLLSDEQYDRLLWITDQLEMPLSEFIRMAVDEKMDSELRKLKQERLSKGMNNGKGNNQS
jgi:hypothetical protein